MAETTISIKRHCQTAQFENISVELSQTLDLEDSEIDGAYKRLSARVEKYVGHELRKYKPNPDSKKVR